MSLCLPCKTFTADLLSQKLPSERWTPWRQSSGKHQKLIFEHSTYEELIKNAICCKLCALMLTVAEKDALSRPTKLGCLNDAIHIKTRIDDTWQFVIVLPIDKSQNIHGAHFESSVEIYQKGNHNSIQYLSRDTRLHDNSERLPEGSRQCGHDAPVTPSIRAELSESSDSDHCFALAKHWLHHCCTSHNACARSQDPQLPSRVIDVGLISAPQGVRIINGDQLQGKYITLSHVWGGTKEGSTTKHNISHRMKSLPLTLLPKSFCDAILITRRLGFRYLWIDSLCIIQDSTEDWERECRNMSQIYSNSTLTIASLWGRSSLDGFFCDRKETPKADKIPHVCIKPGSDSGEAPMFVRPRPWNFFDATHASTLHQRGWVLQERILSPATLYYWFNELYWECASAIASESQPRLYESDRQGVRAPSNGPTKRIFFDMRRYGLATHSGGHYTAWYLLVESFTSKQLTYPSDRLPAMLGLVRKFRERYSTRHVAGLWVEDLHRGLLWVAFSTTPHATIVSEPSELFGKPSWSWVSIQRRVTFSWSFGGKLPAYYPIKRVDSSMDAEIVDLIRPGFSKSGKTSPRTSLHMHSNLVKVSYQVNNTPSIPFRKENEGYICKQSQGSLDSRSLSCSLESCYDGKQSLYCTIVSTWEHDVGIGQKEDFGLVARTNPILTYALLLQRVAPQRRRSLPHPADYGAFRRVGISAGDPVEVESFFQSSTRRYFTIV